MSRRSSQSQQTTERPSKASGACSRCLAIRQLHFRDGTVHLHGPRNNPCPGSRLPPLSAVQAGTGDDVQTNGQSEGHSVTDSECSSLTKAAEVDVLAGSRDVEMKMSQHPRQQRGKLLKYIPKGARFPLSRSLTTILQAITDNPDNIESWRQLLWFAPTILTQPTRAGRRRNLANVVKKRIERQDYLVMEEDDDMDSKPRKKGPDPKELLLAAVTSKLEEGNIRAATRILCSRDFPVPASMENLAAMQEKHPTDTRADNLKELPDPLKVDSYQVTEKEVADAVRSFPIGSAGGPDGFRPQHLLDLLNNRESSQEFVQALTGFVNVLLRGLCPQTVRKLLFGGTLIALSKKTGGLRPIVIGYVWRRLAAKCANKYAVDKLASFFNPLQVGIATAGGCETAVHAARGYLTNMPQDQVFVKLDFANAFNTLHRDIMLQEVHSIMPELYAFTHQAYAAESMLQFGQHVVRSQMGPQQGDPMGPLLFCLPLQPALRSLDSSFRLGYLDDLSLGGGLEEVQHDLTIIDDLETTLGLRLNRHKCEYYSEAERTEDAFSDFQRVDRGSLLLLGAPIFKGRALDAVLQDHSNALGQAIQDMSSLQAQSALILLRSCFGAAKLTFVLRTAPCWDDPLLEKMDNQLRCGLEQILNVQLNNTQWTQATLPIRDGGLGVRRVSMLASSAYLASAASTRSLGSTILGREDWMDDYKNQILAVRGSTLPMGEVSALTKQSAWDRPLIELDKAEVWKAYTDPCSRARLVAVSSPHSGDWLLTLPISSCGLCLDNEAFRVAVGLRLGLKLCAPHQCRCGEAVDPGGHHGLVCKMSNGRASRHYAINDIIWRALQKADIPSSKEPSGLLRSDGKRPDGTTLVPWAAGKYITWDATNVHTCAASYLHRTSTMAGGRLSWLLFVNRQNTRAFLHHTRLCPLLSNHWDQSIGRALISLLRWGAVYLQFPVSRLRKTTFSSALPSALNDIMPWLLGVRFWTSVGMRLVSSRMVLLSS